MVEHDAEIMRSADRILDLGPGAGENGGRLIASGTYDEILQNPNSLTGRYIDQTGWYFIAGIGGVIGGVLLMVFTARRDV